MIFKRRERQTLTLKDVIISDSVKNYSASKGRYVPGTTIEQKFDDHSILKKKSPDNIILHGSTDDGEKILLRSIT